jgi:hypothetical protein
MHPRKGTKESDRSERLLKRFVVVRIVLPLSVNYATSDEVSHLAIVLSFRRCA